MKRDLNKTCYILYACCLLLAFSACKKSANELPGNTEAVALNFYSASDVMLAAYGSANPSGTAIYVDSFQTHPALFPFIVSTQNKFPVIDYRFTEALEFPTADGGFIHLSNYNYNNGNHRLFFTDTANVLMLDTLIHPAAKSYNCIYLADAPVSAQNQPAVYKLLSVPEDRAEVPAGKVGIRFIHLSPDAGSLTCSLLKADGSLNTLLPEPLTYGQASAYQYLDSSAEASGLIKFSMDNTGNGANVLAGIPFTAGRNYIVLITGFLNDQQRQVRSGKNTGGSTKYTTVAISRNLRAVVRKSY